MKNSSCCKLFKRKMVCIVLGIIFGFLCVWLASKESPDIWGSPLMWSILFNRFLIGVVVFLAGAFTFHPIFKCRIYPWIRGLAIGALVSLDIALGIFIAPMGMDEEKMKMVFWATIIAGALYGLIIDVIASKVAGEGQELLTCEKK